MIACIILINSLAFVAGVSMVSLGVWMLLAADSLVGTIAELDKKLQSGISIEKLFDLIDAKGVLSTIAYVTLGGGGLAILVSTTGIVAALKRSKTLGVAYEVVLLCLLGAQAIFISVLLLKKPTIKNEIRVTLFKSQTKYFVARTQYFNDTDEETVAYTKFFEHMHIAFKCCGVVAPHDITRSASYQRSLNRDPSVKEFVPASCCRISNAQSVLDDLEPPKLVDETCPSTENSTSMHTKPCIDPVYQLIDRLILPGLIISGVFILLLCLAIGTITFQLCRGVEQYDSDSSSDSDSTDSSDSDD